MESNPSKNKLYSQFSLGSILNIFENFPTAVVVKNVQNDFRFEIWNSKAEEVTGMKKEMVLGKTDFELFPREEAENFREKDMFTVTQKGVVDIFEETLSTSKGLRWLQTRKLPIFDDQGTASHILVIFDDITEKRQQLLQAQEAEASKRAAEELKSLAEAIPQMVWTARPDGKVDFRNSNWSKYMKINEETGDLDPESIHPDERESFVNLWAASLREGIPFEKEYKLKTAQGYRWHLARAVPVKNTHGQIEKWFATSTEIEEQKKIEAQLRLAQLRLKTILTSAPIILFSVDLDGIFNYVDGSGLRRFGVDPQRLVGKSVFRVYKSYPWFLEGVQSALLEQSVSREGHGLNSYFQAYFTPQYDIKGKLIGVIGLANDLTEYKKSELERTRLIAREESAIEASRLKSEFLANMSHEIRTPLNGLIGMAQAVLETDLTKMQKDCMDTLLESSEILLRIINDILDISKIEAGKIEIKNDHVNLPDLVDELESHFFHAIKKKNLRIDFSVAQEVPQEIFLDGLRLKQIFMNLIGNAVKFTEVGSIAVKIEKNKNDTLYFSVEDTGIGISAEIQKILFKPFSQGDATLTKNYGGTGLGLAISKNLIELMGGVIGVKSVPEQGTQFWFTLPLHQSHLKVSKNISRDVLKPAAKEKYIPKEKLKILLVEDNEVNRQVINMFLSTMNCDTEYAENGQQAFDTYQRNDYDLILMDCQMPVMDGYEATKKIREFESTEAKQHVPIIGITANAMNGDREKCLSSGMDDYLAKPIRRKQFLDALEKWGRPS